MIEDKKIVKIRNVQTGQYLFVSNDKEGFNPSDNVVEARTDSDNGGRTKFKLERTPSGNFRLFNLARKMYLFVSNDTKGHPADNVVEARANADNGGRTKFKLERTPSGNFRLLNVQKDMYLFVSNDTKGSPPDNVVEARNRERSQHDSRNRFQFEDANLKDIDIVQTQSNISLAFAALAVAFLMVVDQPELSIAFFIKLLLVVSGGKLIGNEIGNLLSNTNEALDAVENAANAAKDKVQNFRCTIS